MPAALAIRDLEKDATPAAALKISCAACDPDNPRAVPRPRCTKCKGAGFTIPEAGSIAGEIHDARLELLRGGSDRRRRFDADD
jgi:hypothetical protein